ncbi:MAG: DsbA family protein [Kangiellaceae bacterium]|nr:DsbA family protein [Kangiellaceae bacterium]MCW9000743.1 DsbA family protein [Kangiellaceae bacterium]
MKTTPENHQSESIKEKLPIHLSYFSDVLCIWAYVGQIRLDELKANYGKQVEVKNHHVTLFGDIHSRIGLGWKDRDGYDGFNQHVLEVASQFPHVSVNSQVWKACRPKSSAIPHLFLKAIQLMQEAEEIDNAPKAEYGDKTPFEAIDWQIRHAFFHDAIDIANLNNLFKIAEQFKINISGIESLIYDGSAMALLCRDMQLKESKKLDGSPTYLLNESRQKLFGNVGYRIIEANILELLKVGKEGQASWC